MEISRVRESAFGLVSDESERARRWAWLLLRMGLDIGGGKSMKELERCFGRRNFKGDEGVKDEIGGA